MLIVENLHAYYGKSHVLRGVSLTVGRGDIVALLGRNGSGRTSTAKAIMGLLAANGSLRWRGQEMLGKKPFEIARSGLGYVPETRDIFSKLTVEQNLLLGQQGGRKTGRWTLGDMYLMFPHLQQRQHTPAGVLSGGEQQMLALCRTLMGEPDLIIIDEPTEGLAPKIVQQVAAFLKTLKAKQVSVLLIEQKLQMALAISDRCAVMGQGCVVFEGTPDELRQNSYICQNWLQV